MKKNLTICFAIVLFLFVSCSKDSADEELKPEKKADNTELADNNSDTDSDNENPDPNDPDPNNPDPDPDPEPPTPVNAVELPDDLKKILENNEIFVVDPVIYVARGGMRHGVTMTEERIKSFFTGWGKYSINPLMLQLGVSFNTSNIKIINIELPMTNSDATQSWYNYIDNFCGRYSQNTFDPHMMRKQYVVTDENGKPQGKKVVIDQDKFRFLLMDEGPTGGYAAGTPHRAMVLNVNGSTRNIIVHEIGHCFDLQHPDDGSPACFNDGDRKWIMTSIIYDHSLWFHDKQIQKARKVVKAYESDSKYRLKSQFRKVKVGTPGFSTEELKAAWELLKTRSYQNANRNLQE
ncbi:MAG: hypothetical protein N4A49_06950 [Marinifilaceae bacterium]|jgi:hypothetical protein|nr:hypothetical protein [Marinifilaceae bacterium]